MEKRFKPGDWVFSNRLHIALEVLPYSNPDVLFCCSVDSANRWPQVFPRLASGLEVFATLDRRDRIEEKFRNLLKNIKDE